MKKLLVVLLAVSMFSVTWFIPQASAKVMWGKTELKLGQIGKVTILNAVDIYKLNDDGSLSVSRKLNKGDEFRVYSYKSQHNGLYGVGGGLFVKRSSSIKYETPSKRKLAQLKEEELKKNPTITNINYLDEFDPQKSGYYYYENGWSYSDKFEDANGRIIARGVGFQGHSSSGTTYADYNISNYGFTHFEADLAIDFTDGDRGKTGIFVYADNKELYQKQITTNTNTEHIKLSIPKGTKVLSIEVKQEAGAKGKHGVIFGNAKLYVDSKNQTAASLESTSLQDLGAQSTGYYVYNEDWDNQPFNDNKGNVIGRGVGFQAHSSNRSTHANYSLKNYDFTRLETEVALDFVEGDRGATGIFIYADDQKLYERQVTTNTDNEKISIAIPKGTETLSFIVRQQDGAKGRHGVVFNNPILIKDPKVQQEQAEDTTSLMELGTTKTGYYHYNNTWDNGAFKDRDGNIIGRGIGLQYHSSSPGSTFAEYSIKNYEFKKLRTNLAVDFINGDRGSTNVLIYIDGNLVYTKEIRTINDLNNEEIELNIPTGASTLRIEAYQTQGANHKYGIILENPVLIK